jgi:hypothetical protein
VFGWVQVHMLWLLLLVAVVLVTALLCSWGENR